MFEVTIRTGGAAFCNPYSGDPAEVDRAMEIVRILETQVIPHLKNGVVLASLRDINGNTVGKMRNE